MIFTFQNVIGVVVVVDLGRKRISDCRAIRNPFFLLYICTFSRGRRKNLNIAIRSPTPKSAFYFYFYLIYFFLFFAHYTDRYGHIREFQFTKFVCSPSAKTCGILPIISVSIYRILFVFLRGKGAHRHYLFTSIYA